LSEGPSGMHLLGLQALLMTPLTAATAFQTASRTGKVSNGRSFALLSSTATGSGSLVAPGNSEGGELGKNGSDRTVRADVHGCV